MQFSSSPDQMPRNNEKESLIISAASFDELFAALEKIGDIQGESKLYSAVELRKKIDQVRNGHRDISYITRTYGLRDQVEKLLSDDKTYRKRVLRAK